MTMPDPHERVPDDAPQDAPESEPDPTSPTPGPARRPDGYEPL
ncbi:hypothetical protein [Jiangella alba]|uniref:Uncharacterized protein n=1 Tax=Jiangella alba TaxID=561176 RepID=A0A1H5PY55_9ACTN|nr:hypothetical protein [Jiangella alba]SEF18665.1 hypothetical protein SAMN04488561_6731 [Jiangella alba]